MAGGGGLAPEAVELVLPPRAEVISVARLVVGAVVAAVPGFDDERCADVRLAVSEACTNAVQAQLARGSAGPGHEAIQIAITPGPARITVAITDHGGGFDPAALEPHPEVTDPARLDHEGGLGIPLLRMLADDVAFVPVAEGMRVELGFGPRPVPDAGD